MASEGRGQADAGLDEHRLGVPGNGLIVQRQAALLVGEEEGLRLRAGGAKQVPEITHGPVVPVLGPTPHRAPPPRTEPPMPPAGRSGTLPSERRGSGKVGTPLQRYPGPAPGSATNW